MALDSLFINFPYHILSYQSCFKRCYTVPINSDEEFNQTSLFPTTVHRNISQSRFVVMSMLEKGEMKCKLVVTPPPLPGLFVDM